VRYTTPMDTITYYQLTNPDEIEVLRGKESRYGDFLYQYDSETINFLKDAFNKENSLYVIATCDGTFAGFISCDTNWWEEGGYFIREIFINPDFQKQNIGTTLVGMCIDHAKRHKATHIVTQTAFENIPMQKLCEKMGFEKWKNPEWDEGITYKLLQ
jgi:RimJ/RimL family protein N-acetyltransferase